MTRKRDVARPYPPDYCSLATLAYRLDYAESTIESAVKRGLLPKPTDFGLGPRWRWADVDRAIKAIGGELLDNDAAGEFPDDPYIGGLEKLRHGKAANA